MHLEKSGIDKIDNTGICNENTGDYTHKLKLIKRIIA